MLDVMPPLGSALPRRLRPASSAGDHAFRWRARRGQTSARRRKSDPGDKRLGKREWIEFQVSLDLQKE